MLEIIAPGRYRTRSRKPLLVPLLFFVIGLWGFRFAFAPTGANAVISPIPDPPPAAAIPIETQAVSPKAEVKAAETKAINAEELRAEIKRLADSASLNNYSVLVIDYATKTKMGIADTVIYTAASINKIPILTALYALASKGDLDLDKTITLQARDIQDYGTGSIRYAKPGTVYSIKTLARLMISQSDNTAAFILANHIIGVKNIQKQLNNWGLSQTDINENKTSNADIEILFNKILSNQVAREAMTLEMLSFMTKTDFEDRLPALLPDSATVYHKIGTEVGVIHDVGVIDIGTKKYYIGVFVGDVTDEEGAINFISLVSKTVYDYMKNI
jgi:beta-lactamase class A